MSVFYLTHPRCTALANRLIFVVRAFVERIYDTKHTYVLVFVFG
jgi:hypothetical protein